MRLYMQLKSMRIFMKLHHLRDYCEKRMDNHPNLALDIDSRYRLAVMEVQEGSPEHHECQLAVEDVVQLIKESDE